MDELKIVNHNSTQYIVVKLGSEQFGIDIKYVDNIVRMQKITRVPSVPEFINGVINLRGEIVPVMSLRKKMGLEEDDFDKDTRIIILKLDTHELLGVIVDAVREVVTIYDDQVEHLDFNTDENNYVQAVAKMQDSLISLLDLQNVINEKESN